MKRLVFLIILSVVWIPAAWGALSLELTRGTSAAMPIGLVPFTNENTVSVAGGGTVSAIIRNDLQNSGEFRVIEPGLFEQLNFKTWQSRGANNLIQGEVLALPDGRYQVSFKVLNIYAPSAPVVIGQTFVTDQIGLRKLAHHISDVVYEKLTGVRGIFSTKIAYVLMQRYINRPPMFGLEVADQDGFAPRSLLVSGQPIMSPTWMPNGRDVAYVSFEGLHASIYMQDVYTGKRQLVSSFPGINGAPAFSSDGTKLALVLSNTGNPNIYVLDLMTRRLTQITNSTAIDTEPAWAPDKASIVFTSSRGGTPQIYRYYFANGRVERISFDGNYNARASFLPDGKSIIMMHRETSTFGIAKQDLSSGFIQNLTNSGNDESPTVAPNGKMVLYARQDNGRGILAAVSIDGRIKLRLPSREGNVQEPAWSPFLNS